MDKVEEESHDISDEEWEDCDDEDDDRPGYITADEQEWNKYMNAPWVTLSSHTEANREGSTIPALWQRSYTGRKVISSALANTFCADLGVDGVLEKLNTILGTSYTLDESVISVLNSYVAQNDDFGTAYAYLRRYWYDIPTIEHELCTREEKDREMRRNVLVDGRITTREVYPRHVWDVCANRVVPSWVTDNSPWGISHAWVDEKDSANVMTPINGNQWPVPMPKDANLDLIRIEMLNWMATVPKGYPGFGAECAWLDILCLRQECGEREDLRKEEWKLDVPTIGYVYNGFSPVMCYFNGLGRPLHLTPRDFETDRSWFRRAWTLQEITVNGLIIGGETGNNVMEKQVRKRFDKQLTSLREMIQSGTIFELVSEMRHRVSTKPLDKVAGLVYRLRTDSIPIYDTEQSEGDAWEVLMDVLWPSFGADLLFFYPEPGNRSKCWRPSWEQIMTNESMAPRFNEYPGEVYRTEDSDADWYAEGFRIESGDVRGLAEVPEEPKRRQGVLVFKDMTGAPHTLKIVAPHAYPIPDGLYTLICYAGRLRSTDLWVVGQLREDGKFKKLSVFRSADDEQVRFVELALEKPVKIFLC
ncbi:hypothetical protein EV421DRAFT_2090758 [Armillaria borealis]|uniref:Heterokaryon incompatibility domain-containing protein n=1 Tax=Armillaria borealis TaxID=47425 RepID=A0AA39IVM2_9AGAR|nr:hypothetical protein EV421DRAFT_2090758 [Armillaria borealis]